MKFSIHGVVYDPVHMSQVQVRDCLAFQAETRAAGREMTTDQIKALNDELNKLKYEERIEHPMSVWVYAVYAWAAKAVAARAKGEEPPKFMDSLDFSIADVENIPEPGDEVDPDPKSPSPKAKRPARKASAPAVASEPATSA